MPKKQRLKFPEAVVAISFESQRENELQEARAIQLAMLASEPLHRGRRFSSVSERRIGWRDDRARRVSGTRASGGNPDVLPGEPPRAIPEVALFRSGEIFEKAGAAGRPDCGGFALLAKFAAGNVRPNMN